MEAPIWIRRVYRNSMARVDVLSSLVLSELRRVHRVDSFTGPRKDQASLSLLKPAPFFCFRCFFGYPLQILTVEDVAVELI